MPVWDSWVPGVLSRRQLMKLRTDGWLGGIKDDQTIDHSSFDLHLTREAWRLPRGSVKPWDAPFLNSVIRDGLAVPFEPEANGHFHLIPRNTYVFRIRETLDGLKDSRIYGQATAKSSIGRLDVLARLIVDGMSHYESLTPKVLGEGSTEMFLEVSPFTFPIAVREGVSLSQLRLFYGQPYNCEVRGEEVVRTCFAGQPITDHVLTVDLTPIDIHGVQTSGFCATEPDSGRHPIPLWGDRGTLDPKDWWKAVEWDEKNRLQITKSNFYILRSKELLSIPPGIAVYARAIDEEIGEMRIHYAGFAHPFFGWSRDDQTRGTPLIFEVRGHDVDVSLRDGEVLARLQFFRMSEDAQEDDDVDESYNQQTLKLSKVFSEWSSPPKIHTSQDGASVEGGMEVEHA